MSVPVFRTVAVLRAQVRAWHAAGETVALIPTMGALHRGHMALVTEGLRHANRAIATVFVNPAQFAPTEDFAAYPRTFDDDLAKLADAGAHGCFAPTVAEMYPQGFSATVTLGGPAAADLEDRFRPTHFAGVATVVAKLLNQAQADIAVFGEKDFQQLLVVRALTCDLDLPVEIVGLPTVREPDGLALSSRNAYLSAQERAIAPTLFEQLARCSDAIRAGMPLSEALAQARDRVSAAGFALDYLEARDSATLAPAVVERPMRLLVAARVGHTRLIDNVAV